MARPKENSGTLPYMTFPKTTFKGHNQHSKSLNKHKQYRELTKYSHFYVHIFKQDFLQTITNNLSIFLSTGPILALNSILFYKLLLVYLAGSKMEKAPS